MGKTIVLTCLALIFSSKMIAQIDGQRLEKYKKYVLGKYNYKIDSLNEDYYVEYIRDLIKHKDDDSSYKASKLMTALRLYHFDKYNYHFFAKEIDTIRKRAIENIESNFNGQWRFTHNFISGLSPVLSDYKASDT